MLLKLQRQKLRRKQRVAAATFCFKQKFLLRWLHMSNRHLARTMAMQCLYEWDFRGRNIQELDRIIAFVKEEFAKDFDDNGYVEKQVRAIADHLTELDELLNHFAPNWSVDTMTIVDRNILRLGAYELRFDDSIPSIVAINEAIELGKTFGGEASGKFVNGVLGAVYKDMLDKGQKKQIDIEMEQKKAEAQLQVESTKLKGSDSQAAV